MNDLSDTDLFFVRSIVDRRSFDMIGNAMKLTDREIHRFREKIFQWWKDHRRDLPWRHTYDPYRILVSEVMLQQTQVSRVLPKYSDFIDRYPDVRTLALASTADVLRTWQGMGYNRRALYLKKAAKVIVEAHNGIIPNDERALMKLPGLGTYTARAILVFAYQNDISLVDTNIRKIILHFFFNDAPAKEQSVRNLADRLLPKGKSWEWHQALMDYGALALPSFIRGKRSVKKGIVIFRESDRFYRGRIVDALRKKTYDRNGFLRLLEVTYQKPRSFFDGLLEKLMKEGMVTEKGLSVSLPE